MVSSIGSSSSTLAVNRSREAFVEVHVRSARHTDLDAAVRLLARGEPDEANERTDATDYLRNLLYVPSATVVVAEAERRVVGVGVLAIRPSVRSGPFVGVIDEIGTAQPTGTGRRRQATGDRRDRRAPRHLGTK